MKVYHYHTHMLLLIILTMFHLNMKSPCIITYKNMVLSKGTGEYERQHCGIKRVGTQQGSLTRSLRAHDIPSEPTDRHTEKTTSCHHHNMSPCLLALPLQR